MKSDQVLLHFILFQLFTIVDSIFVKNRLEFRWRTNFDQILMAFRFLKLDIVFCFSFRFFSSHKTRFILLYHTLNKFSSSLASIEHTVFCGFYCCYYVYLNKFPMHRRFFSKLRFKISMRSQCFEHHSL